MTIVEQVRRAIEEARQGGVAPTAVVLGKEQLYRAMREADSAGNISSPSRLPDKILGLIVLSSPKVAGPLVIADDVRHSLQALGIFTLGGSKVSGPFVAADARKAIGVFPTY